MRHSQPVLRIGIVIEIGIETVVSEVSVFGGDYDTYCLKKFSS